MRICFVSRRVFPTISGMSVYARNLVRQLVARGHEVTLVGQYRDDAKGRTVYGGGPPEPEPGARVVGAPARGEADGGDFERDVDDLVDLVAAEHAATPFDVLHAQYGFPPGLAVLEAGRQLDLPTVVSVQGGDGHWVGDCCARHRDAMRLVLDHAGAVLIGCRSFAAEVTQRLGTDPARFTIVPGAVDTSRFRPMSLPRGGTRLLYHGRVDRRKGVLDLLEAMPAIRRAVPGTTLVVSGVGPDLAEARARAERPDLAGLVTFTGYVAYDQVPHVYAGADVFVSPTYAEGFSNTLLEAMACGVPVVATRSVGVVDCIRDGENGLLVDVGDIPALAQACTLALLDRRCAARLRHTALTDARERYAWPVVAEGVLDAYEHARVRRPAASWRLDTPVDPGCRFRAAPSLL